MLNSSTAVCFLLGSHSQQMDCMNLIRVDRDFSFQGVCDCFVHFTLNEPNHSGKSTGDERKQAGYEYEHEHFFLC